MNIIEAKLKFKSDNFGKNIPRLIIIHHALHNNCTIKDVHKWHLDNKWQGFGYHYFIDKEGLIYRGRKDEWNGAHCKEDGMNYQSLGVCLEGCYTDYGSMTEKVVPAKQIDSLILFIKYKNLPIKYHRDYANYKDCPGKYFLKEDYLNTLLGGNDKEFKLGIEKMYNKKIITDKLYWTTKAKQDKSVQQLFINAGNKL